MTKVIHVSALVLQNEDGKLLLCNRPHGAYKDSWEFPGGKWEEGETPENALVREIEEELAIQIQARELTPIAFASHYYEKMDKHAVVHFFLCRSWQGDISPQEGQTFTWIELEDTSYDDVILAGNMALMRDLRKGLLKIIA